MAFQTYQCEAYKKYLADFEVQKEKIYKLIESSPFTTSQLYRALGVQRKTFEYRWKNRILTTKDLTKLLDFIK